MQAKLNYQPWTIILFNTVLNNCTAENIKEGFKPVRDLNKILEDLHANTELRRSELPRAIGYSGNKHK